MKINPKDYDFLWKVDNFSYFHLSYYLQKIYKSTDLIATYKDKKWKLYISKKDRMRLSELGLNILEKDLPNFARQARLLIKKAEKTFSSVEKKDFSAYDNLSLAKDFRSFIMLLQNLWNIYFYTECFMFDKIQENINLRQDVFLKKQLQKMGEIKLTLRSTINRTLFGCDNLINKYLHEIGQRLHITDFTEYSYKEIADILEHKKDRKICVMGKFNDWKDIYGEEAEGIISRLEKEYMGDSKVLHGSVGNKGLYRGRVRIIPFDIKGDLAKKIAEMNPGEVLVSGSTGPEMILGCKKAGAIVTDEGGILSHAAVISRELNIPSVIGTKTATEILKDGDLVEVDANKGIVRIVSHMAD